MEVLITVTGIDHYIDIFDLSPGQKLSLKKEPNNKFDCEAIAVLNEKSEKIGYVAKSTYTMAKGTYSAGRLYDKFEDDIIASILVITSREAIATVNIDC